MEELLIQSQALIAATSIEVKRFLHQEIRWENRLIGIVGARGTGKTTLLLQHLKKHFKSGQAVYLSLDDIYFTEHGLRDVVRLFHRQGFTHFFLDEVHKYPGWSREIKNLYDFEPGVHIVFTGSSIIDVLQQEVDLSRRTVLYELPGLSFREYLALATGLPLPAFTLKDILHHHQELADEVLGQVKPLQHFRSYLEHGYYPFFAENLPTYHHRLRKVLRLVLESDLAFITGITTENIQKIHRLIYILASHVPFKPNVQKLSERVGLHRNTFTQYLHYLEKARIINMLGRGGRSISTLQKPDKIYLENTNLAYALAENKPEIGNIRETFFLNQVKPVAPVGLAPKGDFLVNGEWTFEVGGQKKGHRQISNVPHAFIAADDIERGAFSKIPLWLFGFLY